MLKLLRILPLILIILGFATSLYAGPYLSDRVAIHWNTEGKVDGYAPKQWGMWGAIGLMVLVYLALKFIPRLDPHKERYLEFQVWYDGFIACMVGFLLYLHLVTILFNLGEEINVAVAILPALALLFGYIGILLPRAKQNWFIGIRTPWTLSNEKVWDETHIFSGKIFLLGGAIILLSTISERYAFLIMLITVITITFTSIAYSYLSYRRYNL